MGVDRAQEGPCKENEANDAFTDLWSWLGFRGANKRTYTSSSPKGFRSEGILTVDYLFTTPLVQEFLPLSGRHRPLSSNFMHLKMFVTNLVHSGNYTRPKY